jgi:hypothetical protein
MPTEIAHRFENPHHCERLPCSCGHWQFPSPIHALGGRSKVVLQNCSGSAQGAKMDGSQVCFPGQKRWPADQSASRKSLRETGDPRREQQGGENRL